MDKVKYVKLEQPDGSYSDSIPLAVDADYVDVNGSTLTKVLNNKANKDDINNLQIEINGLASGSPLVASSISEMTDTTRVYVNTTDGYWYTYDGTSWVARGQYQASSAQNELDKKIGKNNYSDYESIDLTTIRQPGNMKENVSVGNTISFGSQAYYSYFEIPCNYYEKYKVKFRIRSGTEENPYPYIAFTDENNIILKLYKYYGADGEFKEVELSVPYNAEKLYFWSYSNEGSVITNANCAKSVMISVMEEVNDIKEKTLGNPLPDYYYEDNWLSNKVSEIREKTAMLEGVVFGFITDLHFKSNSLNSKYLLNEVFRNTSINFAIAGGDYPANDGSIIDLKESGNILLDYIRYNDDKILPMHGNHDFSATDTSGQISISNKFAYDYIIRPVEEKIHSENGKMYWYKDIENQKIRLICLDGWENYPPESNANNTIGAWISQEQYDWFINLLNNSNGYSVIIFSHSPLNSSMTGYVGTHLPLHNLLKAFKERTTYSFNRTGTLYDGEVHSISFNAYFTNCTGDLVCVINGHAHVDESLVVDGILDITTTCDAHYTEDGYSARAGTLTEQAFDIFCIDTKARTIKTIRIGRGNNRSWNY